MNSVNNIRKIIQSIIFEATIAPKRLANVKFHRLPFGKYYGENFKEVPDNYLRWFTKTTLLKGQNKLLIRNILNYYADQGLLKHHEIDEVIEDKKVPAFLEDRPYVLNKDIFAFEENAKINHNLLFLWNKEYSFYFTAENGGLLELNLNNFLKIPNSKNLKLKKGKVYRVIGDVISRERHSTRDGGYVHKCQISARNIL